MSAADALRIASDLSALAGYANDVINDPNIDLTAQQNDALNGYNTDLTGYSNRIATNAALSALGAAQSDLDQLTVATKTANLRAKAIKADATELNTVLSILGAAASFGTALVTGGSLASVLGSAVALKSAAS